MKAAWFEDFRAWVLRHGAADRPLLARAAVRLVRMAWWLGTGSLVARLRASRRRVRHFTLPVTGVPDPKDIHLPNPAAPLVSVIIPTYGQVSLTLRCLAAIARALPSVPLEIIVIDDAAPDPDIVRLTEIGGIRLIRHTRNQGFLLSCNAAAATASGAFLMFLNNDTQVLPGWLDALLKIFHTRPDAGLAGAMLLYPDSSLQEAGGIVWDDGSAWNAGRTDDPMKPEHNYVREVDYCSAAALLVRREVFISLGGFDPRYAPAYYEDTDLAFRIRALGLKTFYAPRARIFHQEGASHGTDPASGVKARQRANQEVFRTRWADLLARDHFPNGTHLLRARERGRHRPVVLVIDHAVPQPDRDGGSRNLLCFLETLLASGALIKFRPDDGLLCGEYGAALQQAGVHVLCGDDFSDWLHANGADIDLVLVCRPIVAHNNLPLLRRHTRARIVYYGHDLHGLRLRRQVAMTGKGQQEAARMERLEQDAWAQADLVLYPSAEEIAEVARLAPGVRAQQVQLVGFTCFAEPRLPPPGLRVLFVAGFSHPPNEDAAMWFTRDIWPLIRKQCPAATLDIVGSNPTETIKALAGDAIGMHANVSAEALAEFYRTARVAVVPLRVGAGVKVKVAESLRDGVPLVTTPIGAQGVPGLDSIADVTNDAETFATAVVRLLRDDTLWQSRCRAQIAQARATFSQATMQATLLAALDIRVSSGP